MKSFFMYTVIIALSLISIGCSNVMDPVNDTAKSPMIAQTIPTDTQSDMSAVGDADGNTPKRRDTPPREQGSIFRELLMKLQLTAEQKVLVDKILANYNTCTTECTRVLKTAEREILTNARIAEEQIKKDLDAGLISKTEAREKRTALRKAVNEQLKNIPIRNNVKECMQSCDAAFIKNLEPILNPDQLQMLKQWSDAKQKRTK